MVTEPEIEQMLTLSAEGKFPAALAVATELLKRVDDAVQRMIILYEIITCSTWLGLEEQKASAIRALDPLVGLEVACAFAAMNQAAVDVEAGRADQALKLIDRNLQSSFIRVGGYKDLLYENPVLKANARTRLARCAEALSVLDEAAAMLPG